MRGHFSRQPLFVKVGKRFRWRQFRSAKIAGNAILPTRFALDFEQFSKILLIAKRFISRLVSNLLVTSTHRGHMQLLEIFEDLFMDVYHDVTSWSNRS